MEQGALIDTGILGQEFQWWIGQIADDSSWRDNILTGKFKSTNTIPGWGYRYKVRIMGRHDQSEETIPTKDLPWAQVMYPVTAGTGMASAYQTPNIRQGMFCFGFYLDPGPAPKGPIIMGLLGNNAQAALKTVIGDDASNFFPTSGYATGQVEKEEAAQEKASEEDLRTEKAATAEQEAERAAPSPGASVNKYGLPDNQPITQKQQADINNARQEFELLREENPNLTQEEEDAYIKNAVSTGIKARNKQANSPGSPAQPGATRESSTAVHELSAADVKLQSTMCMKTPLLKPDDIVGSSAKAIQTISDNMTKKLDTYINSLSSYIDAVGSLGPPINPDDIIGEAACKMSKYMKIQMDKVAEYVQKETNKSLNTVVSGMPSAQRAAMADIKEITSELLLCQYNKITNDMCGMIEGILKDMLNFDNMLDKARANADNPSDEVVTPRIPPCVGEDIIGQVLSANKDAIDAANNSLLDNINAFLQDIRDQMAGISGAMSNITGLIGKISGSMTSALSFENVKLKVFDCELPPTPAVSDYYTFCNGGAGVKDTALPSIKKIEEAVNRPTRATPTESTPFVEPTVEGTQNIGNADEDWLSESLSEEQREDIMNDPNIDIG